MKRTMACVTMGCAMGAALSLGAAVTPGADAVWAASRDRVTFRVESGETAKQTGAIMVEPGGRFEKSGAGTMELETARIGGAGDFNLTVREGALKVTGGTAAGALSMPSAILEKAALWLDAAYNVVETNDDTLGTYVSEWRDRRETQTSAPFDYVHGYTMKMSNAASEEIAALRPQKATGALGAAIDFKGYGSHCLLGFQAAGTGTAPETHKKMKSLSCYDVFVVHSLTRKGNGSFGGFGFLLGAESNTYHPAGAGFDNTKTFIRTEYAQQFDARWWLNGVERDASLVKAALGDYVFDAIHYGELPAINSLCCYNGAVSTYFNRCGGDHVYEVILFTSKLTEAEHAEVRRYLTDKYGKTPSTVGGKTILTAANTTLELGAGADGASFAGGASLTKTAGVDLLWKYHNDLLFGGVFALASDDAGETRLRDDLALSLAGDGILTADTEPFHTAGAGISLASGTAGTLVKEGRDNAHILALPSGVTTLDVRKGVLTLSPEHAEAAAPGIVAATVTNPDFQLNNPTSAKYLNGHISGNPSTINGWTCIYTPGWEGKDVYAIITPTIASDGNWYQKGKYGKTDSTDAWLALRGAVQVYTSVNIPVTGRYEISFDLSHDMNCWNPMLTVWFGPDTNHLQRIGAAGTLDHLTWSRQTVRTPELAAGDGVLVFRQDVSPQGDKSYFGAYNFIDNIAITSMTDDLDVFDIPNGNFELFVTNAALTKTKTSDIPKFGTVFSEGWEYVQPDWTNVTTSATVIKGMGYANFNCTIPSGGVGQLVLGSSNAIAKTTFTMPAGTWKLRADLAPWRRESLTAKMKPQTVSGEVHVSVTISGVTTDLGSISLPGLSAFVGTWDTAFTVPAGGAEVKLTLWVSTLLCAATVDNLVCVPAGTDADNLVTDGEFDQGIGSGQVWQSDTSTKTEAGTPRGRVAAYRGTIKTDYTQYDSAPESWDDKTSGYIGVIGDCGALYQTLTVPADGRYRLTYHTRMRLNGDATDANCFIYGFNSLRFQLTAKGVTNVLDETNVGTTNWVRHTSVFAAKAGTYEFRIAGLNVPTKASSDSVLNSGWDKRAFVDNISIVREDSAAPSVTLPEELAVNVAAGAKLRLGFAGTNKVGRVRLGGRSCKGIISAETQPDYILGEGALEATPAGFILIVR